MPETPKGAKKPQDHKAKAEEQSPIIEAECRGETWKIEREALDDFELLDDISAADDGDVSRVPSIMRRLLGVQQQRAAMNLIRDKKTGRVSIEEGSQFVMELLEAADPNS